MSAPIRGPVDDVIGNYLIARELLLLLADIMDTHLLHADDDRLLRDRIDALVVRLKAGSKA